MLNQFHWIFKEKLFPILFKLFHKIEKDGTLESPFYEASVIIILKPDKDDYDSKTRQRCIKEIKSQTNIPNEHIFKNKILANHL